MPRFFVTRSTRCCLLALPYGRVVHMRGIRKGAAGVEIWKRPAAFPMLESNPDFSAFLVTGVCYFIFLLFSVSPVSFFLPLTPPPLALLRLIVWSSSIAYRHVARETHAAQPTGGGDADHAHPRQHRSDVLHDDRADPGADHHCKMTYIQNI